MKLLEYLKGFVQIAFDKAMGLTGSFESFINEGFNFSSFFVEMSNFVFSVSIRRLFRRNKEIFFISKPVKLFTDTAFEEPQSVLREEIKALFLVDFRHFLLCHSDFSFVMSLPKENITLSKPPVKI
jgi:hypothetical protein